MDRFHDRPNRKSVRAPEYDYSQLGAYFMTLVTHERACLFGEIIGGRMVLSPLGRIAAEQWLLLPGRFPNWATDAFQIMPNHLHGVLSKGRASEFVGAQRSFNNAGSDSTALRPVSDIKETSLPGSAYIGEPGALEELPTGAASPDRPCTSEGSLPALERSERVRPYTKHVSPDSLGAVVRAYKAAVTFRFQLALASPGQSLWQRNYFEHIIRDEEDLTRIRLYILENPLRWPYDDEFS